MEEEVCYSTVIFKSFENDKSKELQSDDSIYAEVKKKEITSEISPESSEKEVSTPISPSHRRATLVLGLLCFLLLSALTAVSILYYNHVTAYKKILTLYTEEMTVNHKLLAHNELLETEKRGLITEDEELNSTLSFILKQNTLSVEHYCQFTGNRVQCKPCPKNWIQNGSSCYYFHLGGDWNTWTNSQKICKGFGAHLAIIDNVEEQEFINQHTEYYYDEYHGYWIGLSEKSEQGGTWVWTSGAKLEGGFWIYRPIYRDACVLSMASTNPIKSWQAASCHMYNRWICELNVLRWPDILNFE
ncbi:C-type lectin domain family 12 member A [Paramisgurnus dabryanus]|uniref:C-type lectin domain family 12 member A n=1 Tax=Paramisgurnus dabryanus TaxID=90735 RepID=UPI0031F42ACB